MIFYLSIQIYVVYIILPKKFIVYAFYINVNIRRFNKCMNEIHGTICKFVNKKFVRRKIKNRKKKVESSVMTANISLGFAYQIHYALKIGTRI